MKREIVEYVNRHYGYNLREEYYHNIEEWRSWWQGFYPPFHRYDFNNGKHMGKRDMFTLKMAKKVCEDWASILLNEKTCVEVVDSAAREFLLGKNGVLAVNDFWLQANSLIERAFYSGTGAVVLRVNNLKTGSGGKVLPGAGGKISLNYLSAEGILPLSWHNGQITEVAFCSEQKKRGESFIYLELHTLNEAGHYVIRNNYFSLKSGVLQEEPLPAGVAATMCTGSEVPLFALVSPNIVNNLPYNCGLGVSVFANAIDNLKGVDLAFNNLNCDFKLGGKKVFLDRSLLELDAEGEAIVPDDANQQLFCYVGDGLGGEGSKQLVQEHNPLLRVEENRSGLQAQLDYLSFKCGFGAKFYELSNGYKGTRAITATEYVGEKQELLQNASKHYLVVRAMLERLFRGILWVGKNMLGVSLDEFSAIEVRFDDSIIVDKDSQRARDLAEVQQGLMLPWEFRSKWYGESESRAKEMLANS